MALGEIVPRAMTYSAVSFYHIMEQLEAWYAGPVPISAIFVSSVMGMSGRIRYRAYTPIANAVDTIFLFS